MSNRVIHYATKPRRGLLQICVDWQLTTALSIITLIVALNISFPELSDASNQTLSTYQTRLPTIQYKTQSPNSSISLTTIQIQVNISKEMMIFILLGSGF